MNGLDIKKSGTMKKRNLLLILPLVLVSCGKRFDFSKYEWIPITEVYDRAELRYAPAPAIPLSEEEFQSYSDEKFDFREYERSLHVISFLIDDLPKVKVIAFKFHYVCPVLAQSHKGQDWAFSMDLIQTGTVDSSFDAGFVLTEDNAAGSYEYYFPDSFADLIYRPESIEVEEVKFNTFTLQVITSNRSIIGEPLPSSFVCQYDELYVRVQY